MQPEKIFKLGLDIEASNDENELKIILPKAQNSRNRSKNIGLFKNRTSKETEVLKSNFIYRLIIHFKSFLHSKYNEGYIIIILLSAIRKD